MLESLRKGWKITNDGLKIEIKKRRSIITFDRVIKCPTGHLTGVKLVPEEDTSLLATHEPKEKENILMRTLNYFMQMMK